MGSHEKNIKFIRQDSGAKAGFWYDETVTKFVTKRTCFEVNVFVKHETSGSQPVSDLLQVFVQHESTLGHRQGWATATVSLFSFKSPWSMRVTVQGKVIGTRGP